MQIAELDRELEDLAIAARVLARLGENESASEGVLRPVAMHTQSLVDGLRRAAARRAREGRPVKEVLLEVLRDAYPIALQASEVRRRARDTYRVDVNPNTLTVSLSRFRDAGLVSITNKKWSYVPDRSEPNLARLAEGRLPDDDLQGG